MTVITTKARRRWVLLSLTESLHLLLVFYLWYLIMQKQFFFPLEEIHNEIAISHCFGDSNLLYYVIGFGLFILHL